MRILPQPERGCGRRNHGAKQQQLHPTQARPDDNHTNLGVHEGEDNLNERADEERAEDSTVHLLVVVRGDLGLGVEVDDVVIVLLHLLRP